MGDITELLARAAGGDRAAISDVFRQVYPELRRIAQAQARRSESTLTPTVLVHEVYLRLVGASELSLEDRRHFFACAARAMRMIVVDHVRAGNADKRGGGLAQVTLEGLSIESAALSPRLLDLDQALDLLDRVDARLREIVELHFFGGLGFEEIGALLGCSQRTVFRGWQRGRAILHAHLQERGE